LGREEPVGFHLSSDNIRPERDGGEVRRGAFGDRPRLRALDSRGKLYAVWSRAHAEEKRILANALPAYTTRGGRRPWWTPASDSVSGARSAWRPPVGKCVRTAAFLVRLVPPWRHCSPNSRGSRARPSMVALSTVSVRSCVVSIVRRTPVPANATRAIHRS